MKKEIRCCDRCKKQIGGSPIGVVLTIPQARACAEDDDSSTEEMDFCAYCASHLLQNHVDAIPLLMRKAWMERMRTQLGKSDA